MKTEFCKSERLSSQLSRSTKKALGRKILISKIKMKRNTGCINCKYCVHDENYYGHECLHPSNIDLDFHWLRGRTEKGKDRPNILNATCNCENFEEKECNVDMWKEILVNYRKNIKWYK